MASTPAPPRRTWAEWIKGLSEIPAKLARFAIDPLEDGNEDARLTRDSFLAWVARDVSTREKNKQKQKTNKQTKKKKREYTTNKQKRRKEEREKKKKRRRKKNDISKLASPKHLWRRSFWWTEKQARPRPLTAVEIARE